MLDRLEPRRLLTELSISGTNYADAIDLTVAGYTKTGLDVRIANKGTKPITVKVDQTAIQLAAAATIRTEQIKKGGVTLVRLVDLGAGDDKFTVDTKVNVRIIASGGKGDDTLGGGSADDQLSGGEGRDQLFGNKGRDLLFGGSSADLLDGGTGNDRLFGNVTTPSGKPVRDAADTLRGNTGDDTITAGPNPARLEGGDGRDTMIDGPSADTLDGGAGADSADYSSRADPLKVAIGGGDNYSPLVFVDRGGTEDEASRTTERYVLGPGQDTVYTGLWGDEEGIQAAGPTSIELGNGDDSIQTYIGTATVDRIYGQNGDDTLEFALVPPPLFDGGAGDDRVVATSIDSEGAPAFIGGDGTDSISVRFASLDLRGTGVEIGQTGVGDVTGDDGPNELSTTIGNLYGMGGDDRLTLVDSFRLGNAEGTAYGGDGNDILAHDSSSFSENNELPVNLLGDDGDDVFVNQNGLPDTIDGGDDFDSVQEDLGNEIIGLPGDTFRNVEYVYDTLADNPTLPAEPATERVTEDGVTAAAAAAVVVSGVRVGLDGRVLRVTASDKSDVIQLTQVGRNVTVRVGSGLASAGVFATSAFTSVAISAGAGDDTVRLMTAAGGSALQIGVRVSGGTGNDTILGGDGNDQLGGDAGDDYVSGGNGNDIVNGDFVVLRGGAVPAAAKVPDGSDTVIGGGGSVDIVTYTYRTAGVTLDAGGGGVSGARGEKDRIGGVEYVIGGQNADVLKGSSVNDTIFGGPGGDDLRGGAGADRLYAGVGADRVTPDGGSDFIDTGPDDVQDDIVGNLGGDGYGPRDAAGILLTGAFNANDYFTLARRFFGEEAS